MPLSLKPVLLVDDQTMTSEWLVNLLQKKGYSVDRLVTESSARDRLRDVASGARSYSLAIIDIMIPTYSLEELIQLEDKHLEESKDSGIRLCQVARVDLGIDEEKLPIVGISARNDRELRDALGRLRIPFFHRANGDDLRAYLDKRLPTPPNRQGV